MKKFLVDTSTIIDCIRKKKAILDTLRELAKDEKAVFLISNITTAELFSGKSAQNNKTKKELRKLLEHFEKISIDEEIAILAGTLRCKYRMSLPDALVASCASFEKATLISGDQVFKKIKEIRFYRN